jgi:hypothetical protein
VTGAQHPFIQLIVQCAGGLAAKPDRSGDDRGESPREHNPVEQREPDGGNGPGKRVELEVIGRKSSVSRCSRSSGGRASVSHCGASPTCRPLTRACTYPTTTRNATITGAFTQPLVLFTWTLPPSAGKNNPTAVNVATAPALPPTQLINLSRLATTETTLLLSGSPPTLARTSSSHSNGFGVDNQRATALLTPPFANRYG